jgi:biopolymer transport protein TolQ
LPEAIIDLPRWLCHYPQIIVILLILVVLRCCMTNIFPVANVLTAFSESGFSGKLIVLVLLLGSMYAWTVMVVKLMQLKIARRQSDRFLAAYRKEEGPIDLFVRRSRFDGSPFYEIYKNTCNALGDAFELSGGDDDLFMGDIGAEHRLDSISVDSVKGMAERTMAEQVLVLEYQMGTVASAATTAPFLGLLGTVLGVMSAFGGMAASGSAMLSAVAPGISSALLTTVVGLLVALPSSLGYNFLTDKIRGLSVGMDNFVQELSSDIEINYLQQR